MNPKTTIPPTRRRPVIIVAAIAVILIVAMWLRPSKATNSSTSYYEVKRGDFTVSVTEGGNLAAVREVSVRNAVEGTSRIITIVPEGSYVKKGDLLVELDSAQAQDQVNQQQISFEKATFSVEQAKAQLDIAKSATNSDYLAAKLKLDLAIIDRDRYNQGQRLVDLVEASNKVVQASAQLSINMDNFINSTNLAVKGYETKMKVDGDGLSVTNTRNSLIVATNGLWMLEQFDIRKSRQKYESDVLQAEQELERVISQNQRKMAQYVADLQTQGNTLELNEQKLIRDKSNLANTKILAPQDGLVVYAVSEGRFSSESLIEGGASIRNRQELIKLPDLSSMKVTIKVHESHVNMIRVGLPAVVVLDSNPDERFHGVVDKVAPLPDTQSRWGNPNLKVYNTDIYITDPMPNIKPGISAKAEVIITNIANACSIPIQAVTTFKGERVVYKLVGDKSVPQPVELGLFNTKFIEVTKGLNPGDRVILSPPFDPSPKDVDGSVVSNEEKARIATNPPPRVITRPADDNNGESVRPNFNGADRPNMGGADRPNMGGADRPNMGGADRRNMGGADRPSMGGSDRPSMGGADRPSMGGADRPSRRTNGVSGGPNRQRTRPDRQESNSEE